MRSFPAILAILAIGLFASPVFALLDDGVNSLGVYFDAAGDQDCHSPGIAIPFNLYFIIANPTSATLGGYEFAWRFDPPFASAPIVLQTLLPPGAINAGKESSIIVDLPHGLVTGATTVVATCHMMLLSSDYSETLITVGPATPARIPGHAVTYGFLDGSPAVLAFRDMAGEGTIDPEGWAVPGVAMLYCPHGPAVEPATWGAVKALFD